MLNFVNNWSDLGGIASYNAAFGGNATTWYTDSVSQKVYKDYIKLLVNRYKCSPAIFAWELANEPRCHGCPTSTIYNWAKEISEYIKKLDTKHMVTLGDEGWFAPADDIGDGSYAYSGAEGVDFVLNLGIKTLDYGTLHLYPDSCEFGRTHHTARGNGLTMLTQGVTMRHGVAHGFLSTTLLAQQLESRWYLRSTAGRHHRIITRALRYVKETSSCLHTVSDIPC